MKTTPYRPVMTVTPHDASEWSRMALAAHAKGFRLLSSQLRLAASEEEISIAEYDCLHSLFCHWLASGFDAAFSEWRQSGGIFRCGKFHTFPGQVTVILYYEGEEIGCFWTLEYAKQAAARHQGLILA